MLVFFAVPRENISILKCYLFFFMKIIIIVLRPLNMYLYNVILVILNLFKSIKSSNSIIYICFFKFINGFPQIFSVYKVANLK